MKTSNKLLLTAILIIIVSMVTYDFALRAEYRKGTYKSRFYNFEKTTDTKAFNMLDNRAANLVSVRVERGDHFGIWMMNDLKDHIRISHNENALVIDVIDKKSPNTNIYKNGIIIICPSLNKVTTSPFFISKEDEERSYYSNSNTSLVGFNQKNLELYINKETQLDLDKNKIANLQAFIGDNLTKHASLTIRSNNQFDVATIAVAGKNSLEIENPKITKSDFTIADSAKIISRGSFLNQLKKEQK